MAKYYYPSCVWPTTVKRSSKSPWSSICHTADLVFSRTQYCLGIDALSLFGKIGSMIVVLSVIFLVCFISLVLLIFMLRKLWLVDYETWDLHFRRNFTGHEIQELVSLSTILSSSRFCMMPDS